MDQIELLDMGQGHLDLAQQQIVQQYVINILISHYKLSDI